MIDQETYYDRQTLIDNVSLLTPLTLHQINDLVEAAAGREIVRKKPGAPLLGHVDSFVAKTDVRHPSDVSLLFDANWTVLHKTVTLYEQYQLEDWRQHG